MHGLVVPLKHTLKRCAHDGCWQKGRACYLPETELYRAPDEYYCGDHAHQAGFCPSCGSFWGGVESFDFSRSGLCENCEAELRHDLGEDDYDDDENW